MTSAVRHTTLLALFKLWGVRDDLAELLTGHLYLLEEDAVDNLIAFMTVEFQKSQSPQNSEEY